MEVIIYSMVKHTLSLLFFHAAKNKFNRHILLNFSTQSNNFQLPTPMCTPVVEYKLFAPK